MLLLLLLLRLRDLYGQRMLRCLSCCRVVVIVVSANTSHYRIYLELILLIITITVQTCAYV